MGMSHTLLRCPSSQALKEVRDAIPALVPDSFPQKCMECFLLLEIIAKQLLIAVYKSLLQEILIYKISSDYIFWGCSIVYIKKPLTNQYFSIELGLYCYYYQQY